MKKRINIAVVESSEIVRRGIVSLLERADDISCNVAEIYDLSALRSDITILSPDIMIVNPLHLVNVTISELKESCSNMSVIALITTLYDPTLLKSYDATISIYDSASRVVSQIGEIAEREDNSDQRSELTPREREIVICIARGMTNKEIADELSLSTHTVISHRRNITAKLEINSSSGLTIYAIVNGLIEVTK